MKLYEEIISKKEEQKRGRMKLLPKSSKQNYKRVPTRYLRRPAMIR